MKCLCTFSVRLHLSEWFVVSRFSNVDFPLEAKCQTIPKTSWETPEVKHAERPLPFAVIPSPFSPHSPHTELPNAQRLLSVHLEITSTFFTSHWCRVGPPVSEQREEKACTVRPFGCGHEYLRGTFRPPLLASMCEISRFQVSPRNVLLVLFSFPELLLIAMLQVLVGHKSF